MDKIKWIIFSVVVLGIFGGIIWLNQSNDVAFNGDSNKVITEGDGVIGDRTKGSQDQKVVLIEYGDYQCPGCGSIDQPVKNLVSMYEDKLTFIFRNFPLTSIHPNALAAATAAEAAGQQGKFWEMHDMLYEAQRAWAELDSSQRATVFEGYATQLGLDVDKFKQDLADKQIADKISRDRTTAKTYDVNSTPTFVINGKKFTGTATNIDELTKAVEDALKVAYPDFQPITPVN
jgi:protein-disulfide isomerase